MKGNTFLGSPPYSHCIRFRMYFTFHETSFTQQEKEWNGILSLMSCSYITVLYHMYFPCRILLMDPSRREIAVHSKKACSAIFSVQRL